MQIKIQGKNFEVSEALKDYAEQKIKKMSKYYEHIISTDITLSTERAWHIVEVKIATNNMVLRGEDKTNDMYSSIDGVMEKLEKQLKKYKGKFVDNKKHLDETIRLEPDVTTIEEIEQTHDDSYEKELKKLNITSIKTFSSKPMLPAEAIKEMESLDQNFFVFFNAKTNRVNVIYEKQKNGYGLIDPIFR